MYNTVPVCVRGKYYNIAYYLRAGRVYKAEDFRLCHDTNARAHYYLLLLYVISCMIQYSSVRKTNY